MLKLPATLQVPIQAVATLQIYTRDVATLQDPLDSE